MTRVLFILKRREDFSEDESYSKQGVSTGLLNSATFVHNMLSYAGIESKLEVVIDNSDIDRVVFEYRPTVVIIEALWVVPEKFEVLARLHPTVKWIVRYHSEAPFIASEGIAMKWTLGYLQHPNVMLAGNAPRFMNDIKGIMTAAGYSAGEISRRVHYLPNYYPTPHNAVVHRGAHRASAEHVDIGCFGAIRPLKNQLMQAIGALHFAHSIGKRLHFHINVGRTEMKGEPILHNLQGLFAGIAHEGHELVLHDWMPHPEFIELVKQMDLGMQVAFSETFNIVAADMVVSGVPIVVSREVPWAGAGLADPTDSRHISHELMNAWNNSEDNVHDNIDSLSQYVSLSRKCWLAFLDQTR